MADMEIIARTVIGLTNPGMTPKELLTAVRARHPNAKKKDISRAAFYATILMSEVDPAKAAKVQDLALASRSGEDTADKPPALRKGRRAPRRSTAEPASPAPGEA